MLRNRSKERRSILFYSSLYSSMRETVLAQKWIPKGHPTYYKLIEELSNKGIPLTILFHCREPLKGLGWIKIIRFKQINGKIIVLPCYSTGFIPWRIEYKLNRLFHFLVLFFLVVIFKPAMIYTDKAHGKEAAFFALIGKVVFLRMYGVTKDLCDFMMRNQRKTIKSLTYYSFLSKFSYVLGTLDGSEIEKFFLKYLHPSVPRDILLNGVDSLPGERESGYDLRFEYNIDRKKKIILFIGRFSQEKGVFEFLELIKMLSQLTDCFIALMIGYGPLENALKEVVKREKLTNVVKIEGSIEHSKVSKVMSQSDLMVSFNKEGNLCNTVLEALSVCLPVLTYKDEHTSSLYRDTIPLVGKDDSATYISKKVYRLITDDQELNILKKKIERFSNKNLYSWQYRIEKEIKIILNILNRNQGVHEYT